MPKPRKEDVERAVKIFHNSKGKTHEERVYKVAQLIAQVREDTIERIVGKNRSLQFVYEEGVKKGREEDMKMAEEAAERILKLEAKVKNLQEQLQEANQVKHDAAQEMLEEQVKRIIELEGKVKKLREALEFYRDEAYVSPSGKVGIQRIYIDRGMVAKQALKETGP